jgi:hypothetical protein
MRIDQVRRVFTARCGPVSCHLAQNFYTLSPYRHTPPDTGPVFTHTRPYNSIQYRSIDTVYVKLKKSIIGSRRSSRDALVFEILRAGASRSHPFAISLVSLSPRGAIDPQLAASRTRNPRAACRCMLQGVANPVRSAGLR